MNILSIDTTSKAINIALSFNGKIIGLNRDVKINDYESVISLIESILEKSKQRIKDIDYFGVCVGPGSFTGIRIGLSTMKALAYSMSKPLIGYKSLDVLANMFLDKFTGIICVMQDARRNNIYSAIFDNCERVKKISPYLLVDAVSLFKKLNKITSSNKYLYFCGDAVLKYEKEIKRYFPKAIILNLNDSELKAKAMISLTKENLNNKSSSFSVLPFYMYPKDCQVRTVEK